MKKKIAFYYQDLPQKHLFEYIANKVDKKKFDVIFTKNLNIKSDFGFYSDVPKYIDKIYSKISFITIGGMDQGKLFWPNFWLKENWSRFDYGILPGRNWADMWKQSSWYDGSRPKKGMLLMGWPKSEALLKKNKKKNVRSILYAPCFETDNKGKDVVDAITNTNIRLLIKHLPWNQKRDKIKFKDLRENNKKINIYAKKKLGVRAQIINSKENIMNFYSKTDILVTDESSCIYEALLFNVPSVSCSDWPMRINNVNKPRAIKKNKSICIYTNRKNLASKISNIFNNLNKYKLMIKNKKNKHFSYIYDSSKNISSFLSNYPLEERKFKLKPLYKKNYYKSRLIEFHNYIKHLV